MDGTNPFLFAQHTTLRVGGPARFSRTLQRQKDLLEARSFVQKNALRFVVLGDGSNILPSDEGFDGCVFLMRMMGREVLHEDNQNIVIKVSAGEPWDAFVAHAVAHGWWGIENLAGIPGTVGATPIQNVGAYGIEVSDCVESVEAFDVESGETRPFSHKECRFGYRDSFFKSEQGKKLIVTAVVFRLEKNGTPKIGYKDLANAFASHTSAPTLLEIRDTVLSIRKEKFPDLAAIGTAGSFFKNPILTEEKYKELLGMFPDIPSYTLPHSQRKIPLAWILDKVFHLNGHSLGNVGLFERQPLVLVAQKGATAKEIDDFARSIEAMVFEKTGIVCEREVQILK